MIDYVGVPTLPAIIEAIDALEEIGRRRDIELVVMGGIQDGVDAVEALCLGADAVAFGTSAIIAGGSGASASSARARPGAWPRTTCASPATRCTSTR